MDRNAVCTWIQQNWHSIQQEAIMRTTEALSMLTADDICNRFLKAGEKYGEFNINSIDTTEELVAEFCDIPSYIAIEKLQDK